MSISRKTLSVLSLSIGFLAYSSVFAGLSVGNAENASLVVAGETSVLASGMEVPVGAAIVTGDGGMATLDINGMATVELAAGSEIRLAGANRRGRDHRIELVRGSLAVGTLVIPKGSSLSIRTPIGACVVSGTAFTVSYRLLDDAVTEEMEIVSRDGEVKLAGAFLETGGDTLRAGGRLRFQVINSFQRQCIYFPLIEVAGQDVNVSLGGGKNAILLHDGAQVEAAMDDGLRSAPFAAVLVERGTITVGGLAISAGMAPAFVKNDQVVMGDAGQLPGGRFTHPKTAEDAVVSHDGVSLTIAGERFDTDLILYPDKVVAGAWLRDNLEFLTNELKMVPKEGVEELIVGTGPAQLINLPEALLTFLADSGVKVELMPTSQAVAEYNQRVEDGKGGTVGAVIILEDYMNANDYLSAARNAAGSLVAMIAQGETPLAGPPLPAPGFMPAPPTVTAGGSRYRPDPTPGEDGGIMTNFAPPPLNAYLDAPISPGGFGSVCTKVITVEIPNFAAFAMGGGGCGCCFTGPGGGGSGSTVYAKRKVQMRVPCFVSDDGKSIERPKTLLPPLPGAFVPGGCATTCLTF